MRVMFTLSDLRRYCDERGIDLDKLDPKLVKAWDRYEEAVETAKRNPPPARWYDEDFTELRDPRRRQQEHRHDQHT